MKADKKLNHWQICLGFGANSWQIVSSDEDGIIYEDNPTVHHKVDEVLH